MGEGDNYMGKDGNLTFSNEHNVVYTVVIL